MTVTEQGRDDLLERYGRWFGEERFAIAFTATTEGDDAKRVTTAGWDKTAPLANGDYGAAYVLGRGKTKNPVIVLRPSNLVVLECDTEEDLLRIDGLELPLTITVRSSKPYKRHYYFRPPVDMEMLPYVAFRFESGKLTADAGRYFLAPPSIHPSGAIYAFLPERGPGDTDIAELPPETYRDLARQARVESDDQAGRIRTDPGAKLQAGSRGDTIFRAACAMRRWTANRDVILAAMLAYNDAMCDPPIERSRVEMQVDGAMKKPGEQDLARALEHPKPDDPEPQPEPWDSWSPIDLSDPKYAIPADPPEIAGLLYAGKRHVISGLPESSKTLISYALLLQALREGKPVAVIDFEMGAIAARRMLTDLEATEAEIASIYFVTPDAPAKDGIHRIIQWGAAYVLIDAAIGAYDLSGLDDNARKDAEAFARTWIRPFWINGISTLLIDHVTKNSETRGKFTIGSERKVGQTDIHLSFEAVKALSRGGSGLIKATVHKDRPAFLQRPTAAVFELHSHPDHHTISYVRRDPHPVGEEGQFRPTVLMEKVSRYLETHNDPVSRNNIETTIKGKRAEFIRQAIDVLIADGYATQSTGPHNSKLVTLERPYRESTDPKNASSSTSSQFVPSSSDEVIYTSSSSSPSTEGTRRGDGTRTSTVRPTSYEDLDAQDQALIDYYSSQDPGASE